jgi:outer membrane protein assembly factor BamB
MGLGLAGSLSAQSLPATTWPQWRGADWTGIAADTSIPTELSERSKLWRIELPGPAGSSPVVWNDMIFLTSVDGDDLVLICVDSHGDKVWQVKLKGTNKNSRDGANSAAPSPITDGTHVWATSGAGFLHCFTMKGDPVWDMDLQKVYGEFDIQFGMTSTPILDRNVLYLQMIHGDMRTADPSVGWVVALDAATGRELWKHERRTEATYENKHSYSSPVIYRDSEREFLVTHGGDYAMGHSLKDGSELWRLGGLNDLQDYNPYLRFVASPSCAPGMIVVPSAKNGPVLCLRPDARGTIEAGSPALQWRAERATPDVSSPLVHRGLVFLCRENGLMQVLDARNGEELYNERMFDDRHRSCPVLVGDRLIVTTRNGSVVLVSATAKPEELSRISLDEEITASPAVANGRIYVRTFGALYAFGNK